MLTPGGLIAKRYTYRNRMCEHSLNYQKSAEAIVPVSSRGTGKGGIRKGT